MKKLFDLQSNNWLIHIFALGILFTGVWWKLFSLSNTFYDDPFHHGEFFASLPSVLAGRVNFFTIHGALDWIPAWFSQNIFGVDKHFLPTKLAYRILSALACLFLYFVIALLTGRDTNYRGIILMASSILVVYLVGYRDVFIMLAIFLYFLCERSTSQRYRNVLEIALGISLAVNILWSFDRGIAGIVGIGLACLIMAISEKRYLLSIGSFVASILVMVWLGMLSLSVYVENFEFLLATSSQWSYGYSRIYPVIITILVAITNGWAIYYLSKQLYRVMRTDWKEAPSLLMLIILCILMFNIATNRADASHAIMAFWMPALAFLYLCGEHATKLSIFSNLTLAITIILFAKMHGSAWLYLGSIIPILQILGTKDQKFTKNLASPRFAIPMFLTLNSTLIVTIAWYANRHGNYWLFLGAIVPVVYEIKTKSQKISDNLISQRLVAVTLLNVLLIILIVWYANRHGNYWLFLEVIIPAIYAIETKYRKSSINLLSSQFSVVAFSILLLCINTINILSNYSRDQYVWMSEVISPPTNRSLVDESVQWVSAEILTVGSHCIFDLSNHGVINGITGLPACTKYTYPVYATQRFEAEMLQQLQDHNPPVVVFSSTHWAFRIDERSMHDRFPKLKDYLLRAYPYEKCKLGYCLRYINQPA